MQNFAFLILGILELYTRVNSSRILTIKNAKLSGYNFYMNLIIWGDFQICISVPLSKGTP